MKPGDRSKSVNITAGGKSDNRAKVKKEKFADQRGAFLQDLNRF